MRLKHIQPDEMTEIQHSVHDEAVAGKRGRAPAQLAAWLYSPEMARHGQRLGAFLRYDTTLPPRLSELAILITARHWTSQYEWYVHKKEALKAGLDPWIIADIAVHRTPHFEDPAAQAVYDFSEALHETHAVPAPIYAAATQALGERGVVELVGLLGYYTLVAMTLNTFEIGVPAGETPELEP